MADENLLKGQLKELTSDGKISISVSNLSIDGGNITVDSALDANSTNPVENRVIAEKLKEMTGCGEFTDGTSGLVPPPPRGSQDKFLRGDGKWVTIETRTSYPFTSDVMAISSVSTLDKEVLSDNIINLHQNSQISENILVGNAERLTLDI